MTIRTIAPALLLAFAVTGCASVPKTVVTEAAAPLAYREVCDRTCQKLAIDTIRATKNANPAAWQKGPASSRDLTFVNLAVLDLRRAGIPAGLNGKRGTNEISHDIFVLPNPTGCRDTSGKHPGLSIIDFVVGSESPSADVTYADVSVNPQGACYADGRYIEPEGSVITPPPPPPPPICPVCPPPPAPKPYPGDHVFNQIAGVLQDDMRRAGQDLNAGSGTWFGRVSYDHLVGGLTMDQSIARHRAEWLAALGLAPVTANTLETFRVPGFDFTAELPPWDPATSDGCSVPGWLKLLHPFDAPAIRQACVEHDAKYYRGGSRAARLKADYELGLAWIAAGFSYEAVKAGIAAVIAGGEPWFRIAGVSWSFGGNRFVYDP